MSPLAAIHGYEVVSFVIEEIVIQSIKCSMISVSLVRKLPRCALASELCKQTPLQPIFHKKTASFAVVTVPINHCLHFLTISSGKYSNVNESRGTFPSK